MYDHPAQMEPMFPSAFRDQLEASALDLIRETAKLEGSLRAPTRHDLAELLRTINSYYSNLIEGHGTRPIDIERALRGDYSREPAKRLLQLESRAHIEVQKDLEVRLAADDTLDLLSTDFLCWLHARFYERLPEELRIAGDKDDQKVVVPGAVRRSDVTVGRHIAPRYQYLDAFLTRFHDAYGARSVSPIARIIAVAASHHRLAWIHPFVDGNGRVVRLVTHALIKRLRLDSDGLWAISRGLARKRDEYFRYLEGADEPRRGDLDGRGALSDRGLAEFCSFFLDTCLDQVRYMGSVLALDGLEQRIVGFVELSVARRELPATTGHLLRDILLRGEVARGEATRITGQSERSARNVVATLLERRLLQSSSERGPLRLGFPSFVVPYYFPQLYPAALEDDIRHER